MSLMASRFLRPNAGLRSPLLAGARSTPNARQPVLILMVSRDFSTSGVLCGNPAYGKTFDKILIANRGEIACRIMRTAKKMGIKTVAVYSDADAHALHVKLADEAVNIGPAPTNQSYLKVEKILDAIKKTGAQAVHPGYGFLSENSKFVKALDKAGVAFIGPSESSMAALGDKIESKILAKNAGVSTIPGFNGEVNDAEHAVKIAREITYPVMVKASAGGGGKGMRIAYNDNEVRDAYRLCKSEAASSFGDDRLLVEKFVEQPRHIEIQIIGDKHGNVYYLPERECSIQRRNQKVIEEAPSVHIDPETRRKMGEQAVALAKRVGYYSAGTVEFLVDPKKNFYFLEMNTRLQVEHPITEYITGMDLVECMIRVAANQKLPFAQKDIKLKGWAIESRVYAEDPEKYLPSIGRLTKYIEPVGKGNEVRCDSGIREGSEISVYYDPMICKLCTYGEDRATAISRMEKALDEYVIKGVTHNIPLLRDVVSHPRFKAGRISTAFLAEEYPTGFKGHKLTQRTMSELATVAAYVHARRDASLKNWKEGAGAAAKAGGERYRPDEWDVFVQVKGVDPVRVKMEYTEGEYKATIYDEIGNEVLGEVKCDGKWLLEAPIIKTKLTGKIGADELSAHPVIVQYLQVNPMGYTLSLFGTKFDVTVKTPLQHELSKYMKERPKLDTTSLVLSPMPGTIVSVNVKEGDTVAEGSEVLIVEAMKMQNVLKAPRVGKIKKVLVKPGQSVAADEILIEFEKNDNNNKK